MNEYEPNQTNMLNYCGCFTGQDDTTNDFVLTGEEELNFAVNYNEISNEYLTTT